MDMVINMDPFVEVGIMNTKMHMVKESKHAIHYLLKQLKLYKPTKIKKRKPTFSERLESLIGKEVSESLFLSKYNFEKEIGKGSTASVYQAKEIKSGNFVTIKVFDKAELIVSRESICGSKHKSDLAVSRVCRRLGKIINEIQILQSLDHPNIIKYIDGFETTHKIYIIMEYIEGQDLFDYMINKGKMHETDAKKISIKLLEALKYCHHQGIWHRDLKLENVLITKDLNVKLIDFGYAEKSKQNQKLFTICGTPLYCSPELLLTPFQINGFHGGPCDVWAFGVLLYVVTSACAPFDDSSMSSLKQCLQSNQVVYPSYFSDSLKNMLKSIFQIHVENRSQVMDLLECEWLFIQDQQDVKKKRMNDQSSLEDIDNSWDDMENNEESNNNNND